MKLVRNDVVSSVIVSIIYISQAVTISPQDFYLIKGSTHLPPQIAYYVTDGYNHGSVKSAPKYRVKVNRDTVFNIVESPVPKFYVTKPIESSQSNAFSKEYSSVPIKSASLNPSKHNNHRYRDDFNFYPNSNGIVPVTPPPPPRGRPPPKGQKPFHTTFQIDRTQRNYMAQQEFDRMNRRLRPHFLNQAIHEIPAPSLGPRPNRPPTTPLRTNLNQLRGRHRQHFAIDEDDRPAQQITDELSPYPHSGYADEYREGENVYRTEEEAFDNLKHQNLATDDFIEDPKFSKIYADIEKEMERIEQSSNSGPESEDYGGSDDENDSENDNLPAKYYTDHHDRYKKEEEQKPRNLQPPKKYRRPNASIKVNPRTGKPKVIGLNLEVNAHTRNAPQAQLFQAARYANDRDDTDSNFVPVKMLASVRHSDIISHRPKQSSDPFVKERIREEGGHVVYTEEGYEDDQYDHGDAERFAKHKTTINRRRKRNVSGYIPDKNLQIIYMLRGNDLLNYLDDILLEATKLLQIEAEKSFRNGSKAAHGDDPMSTSETIQVIQVTPRNKFPYYNVSPRQLSKNSPLRYAEYFNHRALQSAKSSTPYYSTKTKRCNRIDFDDQTVNDKNAEFRSKKRLTGLGDQIDCMTAKLFGADPLDNPVFREEFVTDDVESSLVYDDVIRNIKSARDHSVTDKTPTSGAHHRQQIQSSHNQKEPRDKLQLASLYSNSHRKPSNSSNSTNNTVTKLFGPKSFKSKPSPTILLLDDSSLAQVKNKSVRHDDKDVILLNISTFLPQQIQIRPSEHVGNGAGRKYQRQSTGSVNQRQQKNADVRESLYNLPGPYPKNIVYIGPHGQVSNVFKSNQQRDT